MSEEAGSRPQEVAPGEEDFEASPRAFSRAREGEETYPRSYVVPGRLNLQRALGAYVLGHDRGWDPESKLALSPATERGRYEAGSGRPPFRSPVEAIRTGESPGTTPASPSSGLDEGAGGGAKLRFGVPVPARLDFHRGASTWRDRIPGLARRDR